MSADLDRIVAAVRGTARRPAAAYRPDRGDEHALSDVLAAQSAAFRAADPDLAARVDALLAVPGRSSNYTTRAWPFPAVDLHPPRRAPTPCPECGRVLSSPARLALHVGSARCRRRSALADSR